MIVYATVTIHTIVELDDEIDEDEIRREILLAATTDPQAMHEAAVDWEIEEDGDPGYIADMLDYAGGIT